LAQSTAQSAAAAKATTEAGVTPAMITAFANLLYAGGDGQNTKAEGFVELVGPEKTDRTLLSNYYDAFHAISPRITMPPTGTGSVAS
jgi:hypothetical protein